MTASRETGEVRGVSLDERYDEMVVKVNWESEDAYFRTLYCCRECGSVVRYWDAHNRWHAKWDARLPVYGWANEG